MRLLTGLLAMLLLLSACSSTDTSEDLSELDPQALLEETIVNLQGVDSFALLVEQLGEPYEFAIQLAPDQPIISTTMPRAEGNFVSPNNIYLLARLSIAGLNSNVGMFAQGAEQWIKVLGGWRDFDFAPGFDPSTLLQQNMGFQRALTRLSAVILIGQEQRFGEATYHVRGEANSQVVNDLLFGLVDILEEDVFIDVFIAQDDRFPVEIVVTLPDTAPEGSTVDTHWRIELFDYNQATDFDRPNGVEF